MSKKILKILYVTLKDYGGTNEFINGLKMLQLCKLKDFEDMSKKTIEINQWLDNVFDDQVKMQNILILIIYDWFLTLQNY